MSRRSFDGTGPLAAFLLPISACRFGVPSAVVLGAPGPAEDPYNLHGRKPGLGKDCGVPYQANMQLTKTSLRCLAFIVSICTVPLISSAAGAEESRVAQSRSRFFQLCDLATAQINAGTHRAPFCPQWFVAMGKAAASCICYQEVIRVSI